MNEKVELPVVDDNSESNDLFNDEPLEEKPKRRRKRKTIGDKANTTAKREEKKLNKLLTLQMAHALQVGASVAAIALEDTKWMITETAEAQALGEITVDYLNTRFPNWKKGSPEAILVMGFGSYFAKRLITSDVRETLEQN